MQKGAKISDNDPFDFFERTIILFYLEIPVLAVYKVVNQDNLGVNLLAGPSIGFGINGVQKIKEDNTITTGDIVWDEGLFDRNGTISTDLSVTFGADIQLNLGNAQILLDLRYSICLSNIEKFDTDEEMSIIIIVD